MLLVANQDNLTDKFLVAQRLGCPTAGLPGAYYDH